MTASSSSSPSPSSESTADELESAEALIKLKTTDPDSTLSGFFPRWLQKKKRLLPHDEKSSERGKRLSPDTPLDVPRSPIAGDENPFSRLPPLLSCSKTTGSLKMDGDEKQAESVNGKEKQMMNAAAAATQRNFHECVMEAANRHPILGDDNSSLGQIQSSDQHNQTLAQQPPELFSMGPTRPVDQLPDLNLTPPAEAAAMTMAPAAAAAEALLPDLNLTPPAEEPATWTDVRLLGRQRRAAECAQARKRRLEMVRSKSCRLKRKMTGSY